MSLSEADTRAECIDQFIHGCAWTESGKPKTTFHVALTGQTRVQSTEGD